MGGVCVRESNNSRDSKNNFIREYEVSLCPFQKEEGRDKTGMERVVMGLVERVWGRGKMGQREGSYTGKLSRAQVYQTSPCGLLVYPPSQPGLPVCPNFCSPQGQLRYKEMSSFLLFDPRPRCDVLLAPLLSETLPQSLTFQEDF